MNKQPAAARNNPRRASTERRAVRVLSGWIAWSFGPALFAVLALYWILP